MAKANMTAIPGDPKRLTEDFLVELSNEFYEWYRQSVFRHYVLWLPLYVLATIMTFSTSVLAAFANEDTFKNFQWLRVCLIVFPAVGAGVSTILAQTNMLRRFELREQGRVAVQSLINEGKAKFASLATSQNPADYTQLHLNLVKEITEIEKQQGKGFFSFGGGGT